MSDRNWAIWGGWLWLLSAFLDRADGELARVTGKTSPGGQVFDMFYDLTVTSLFFLGVGLGLRDEIFLDFELGQWPIWLGADGVFAAEIFAEFIDRAEADTGEKAYPGIWGFDFDDILYLFAPVVWLDWHLYFVLGATVGAPTSAFFTWYKWRPIDR